MKQLVHVIEIGDAEYAKREMRLIGVHEKGIGIMLPKAQFKAVKIKNLPVTAANIIKQEMLARGGEAATAYGAISHSVKNTDVLIYGNENQLSGLVKKLRSQYFGLREVASDINEAIRNFDSPPAAIQIGKKLLNFKSHTYIMGILNITPDSFFDGRRFMDVNDAVVHAKEMIAEGADIIDIGGESSRPGAKSVNVKTEISRVVPVIRKLRQQTNALISIDTTKAKVAEAAIAAGANIINDISGLRFDRRMVKLAVRRKVPVVIMHIQGNPRTMQKKPVYKDLVSDIIFYLQKSIEIAIKGGIPKSRIIIDPGIGFGKTTEHNIEILKRLRELKSLGCPILVGTSRKSLIGNILDLSVEDRLEGTAATVAAAILNGANIVRVHDVREMKRVVKMADAILRA